MLRVFVLIWLPPPHFLEGKPSSLPLGLRLGSTRLCELSP